MLRSRRISSWARGIRDSYMDALRTTGSENVKGVSSNALLILSAGDSWGRGGTASQSCSYASRRSSKRTHALIRTFRRCVSQCSGSGSPTLSAAFVPFGLSDSCAPKRDWILRTIISHSQARHLSRLRGTPACPVCALPSQRERGPKQPNRASERSKSHWG